MAIISCNINGKDYKLNVDPQMPLLWAIRDVAKLKGTKYGCGMAQCGACVVHLNGEAVRSCVAKVNRAEGQNIGTIEGLSENNINRLANDSNILQMTSGYYGCFSTVNTRYMCCSA